MFAWKMEILKKFAWKKLNFIGTSCLENGNLPGNDQNFGRIYLKMSKFYRTLP